MTSNRNVNLLAETVSFPGQNIRSVPDNLRHGPSREQAQGFTYGPISMTFICTPGQTERKFFEDWQEKVVIKDNWLVNYYNTYVGTITLVALNKADHAGYTVTIHEAYPKTINAQDFALGSSDSYQTATVEFAFRWWESKITPVPTPIQGGSLTGNKEVTAVDDFSSAFPTPSTAAGTGASGPPGRNYAPSTSQHAPGKPF